MKATIFRRTGLACAVVAAGACALTNGAFAQVGSGLGKGKGAGVSPFDSTSKPEDGNEVVRVAARWLPQIPGRAEAGVAFTFTIDPGWHLYWKNNGDTGMPIMLDLSLPEGMTAGETLWPAPTRHEHAGSLLDYVYENEANLIVPVSGRWAVGDEIGADIEFLVCQEACVPGQTSATVKIPDRVESDWRSRALAFTERVPQPAGDAACWHWEGTTLVIQATKDDEPDTMIFYPEAGDNIRPVNALRDGQAKGDTLRFAYRDAVRKADTVRGVLEIRNRAGVSAFYQVQAPAPK